MAYHFQLILDELKNNLNVFKQLLSGTEEMARWKPSPEKWCLLEVICHLYDEEREDFRFCIEEILVRLGTILSLINPEGWGKTKKYISQNYFEMLGKFYSERESSLSWIKEKISTIPPAGWDCVARHPEIGEIPAYGFLANWLGHDYLHIKQILQIKFGYWCHMSKKSLDYTSG